MASRCYSTGRNKAALFTLKLHRGDGMALLAMNWKQGTPSEDFVGFAIEYREPDGDKFYPLKNRLAFPDSGGETNPNRLSTLLSPIQKFRWVHFPRNAGLPGRFVYRVTPVFMNSKGELSYGEPQQASIELAHETYPGQLNVAFTRGYVSSQAFVDFYQSKGSISRLLPVKAAQGLAFVPEHPQTEEALVWMGFEARQAILALLEEAVLDETARVCMIVYDLNEPRIVACLEKLGERLRIIIDDDAAHGQTTSAESEAERRLLARSCSVKRQHMGKLQHNKIIVVDGAKVKKAICGSTNFSWRGLYVQSNNAVILNGDGAMVPFLNAFEHYWSYDTPAGFNQTDSATGWTPLGLKKIDAQVTFSPHSEANALLTMIAQDLSERTRSSLFFSLAFLYQTPGVLQEAIKKVSMDDKIFVYGISDRKVGGLDLQKPNTNVSPVYASALAKNVPEPFKSEPMAGGGVRMHHKFLVIDFNTTKARVYLGSYNFSSAADTKNGEHLLLIHDRCVATSYMIEALRIFDHYHFRVSQQEAKKAKKKLQLAKPPRKTGERPWWEEHFTDAHKIRDRELFA